MEAGHGPDGDDSYRLAPGAQDSTSLNGGPGVNARGGGSNDRPGAEDSRDRFAGGSGDRHGADRSGCVRSHHTCLGSMQHAPVPRLPASRAPPTEAVPSLHDDRLASGRRVPRRPVRGRLTNRAMPHTLCPFP